MRKALEFYRAHQNKLIISVLLIVIAQGMYLRFEDLGGQSLWLDEAFSAQRARAILKHGYPLLDNGRVSRSYMPVHYMMAAGLVIFDEMHFALRFFPALAGVLLIPVFYLFNRRITGSSIQATVAACVVSFMTYEIAWSRQARMYMILQASGIAALWVFIAFVQKKQLKYLFWTVVFVLLTIFSHPSGYIYPFTCLLIALPELRNIREWRDWLMSSLSHKIVCGVLLLGALGAFVMACFAGIDIFSITKTIAGSDAHFYGEQYYNFLSSILGPVFWMALVGMIIVCWKYRRYGVSLAVVTVLFLYYISCHSYMFHHRYILPVLPFLLAFAVMGPWVMIETMVTKGGVFKKMAVPIGAACLAAFFFMDVNIAPYSKYMLGYTAPQPDWRAAYKHVWDDFAKGNIPQGSIKTVSAYPMFHDLYLGEMGEKYFLPITLTGRKRDALMEPSSSSAVTLNSLNELRDIRGYVILDEMALGMLYHEEMSRVLMGVKPDKVIPGMFKVFIWYIPPRGK